MQKLFIATKILKAALLGAVFCLSIGLLAKSRLSDTSDEKIKKAQFLVSEGQRVKAFEGLKPDLDMLVENTKTRKKIEKLSQFFITEEGQKLFELGESMAGSNPPLALNKFNESLSLEDHNINIYYSIGLVQLAGENCKGALASSDQALKLFNYSTPARLLKLMALDCLSQWIEVHSLLKSLSEEDPLSQKPAVQILLARQNIRSGDQEKGLSILNEMTTQKRVFPEAWYWRWKLDPKQGELRTQYALEYIKNCNSMTPRIKRGYRYDGTICNHVKDVEKHLKKIENQSRDVDEPSDT